MKKEEITYAIVGTLIGLVLGFFVANMAIPGPTSAPPVTSNPASESRTVNSSSQELPPGHPPVNPGETIPAPPLAGDAGEAGAAETRTPETGAVEAGAAGTRTAEGETRELPSLDPLPASSREKRTEQEYKNIQVLKGLPASRLTSIMFAFKNSLGVDCTYCHIKNEFEKDDKPAKQIARKMIGITQDANAKLGGTGRVTCNTCHRGQPRPPE
jgi:hypothetical protein